MYVWTGADAVLKVVVPRLSVVLFTEIAGNIFTNVAETIAEGVLDPFGLSATTK